MLERRRFLVATSAASAALVLPPQLSAENSISCTDATILLKDGRRLGYATYGDSNGWPVLYFHGIPTSRIEARFFAPAAKRNGCNIIAIDRPGIGNSDFQPGRRIVDWLDDIKEFVNSNQLPTELNLNQFSIASFSSGAAYALLCAATLPPNQLRSVGIVSGNAPLEKICGDGGVSDFAYRLAANRPIVTRGTFNISTRQITRRPKSLLRFASRFFSDCDRKIFLDPAMARTLVDSYLANVRCGPDGVMHDMTLLARPWGFCVEDINRTINLWYGSRDITTPVESMGNYLHRAMKNSVMSICPDNGHLSMLDQIGDDMFRRLLREACSSSQM